MAAGVSSTQDILQKLRNIDVFCVVFDNPRATYFAGRILTGKVILHIHEPLKMKGIFIHIKGVSHVHIPDKDRLYDPYQTDTSGIKLPSNEVYFDIKKALSDTETRGVIKEGHHEFPFSMDLPPGLPTSFEGQYGYIRYYCVASVHRPWKLNVKCKSGFTVLSRTDLNRIAESDTSITKSFSKRLRHMLKKTDPVSVSITLNKTGFVPGQSIIIDAEIHNESPREISSSHASLLSKATYRSGGYYRQVCKPVCQTSAGSKIIPSKQSGEWKAVPLKIPAIPPTSMGHSKNISISYILRFKVVAAGIVTADFYVDIPVCVGTVPLRTDFPLLSPGCFRTFNFPPPGGKFFSGLPAASDARTSSSYLKSIWEQPLTPTPPPAYEDLADEYPDLPPPTYEQCVFGPVSIRDEEDGEDTMGEMEFAPHYPYYNETDYANLNVQLNEPEVHS